MMVLDILQSIAIAIFQTIAIKIIQIIDPETTRIIFHAKETATSNRVSIQTFIDLEIKATQTNSNLILSQHIEKAESIQIDKIMIIQAVRLNNKNR